MSRYQSLLDEAVSKLKAERGFIVLYNATTHQLTQFVATYQFDATPLTHGNIPLSKEYQIIQKALPLMAGQKRPLLTHTCDEKYFSMSTTPQSGLLTDRILRSLIAVPMRSMGLIWCDIKFRNGLFQPYDLQALLTLVQRSDL